MKLVLCLPSDSKASHFWKLQVFFPLNQRFASLQGKRLYLALKKYLKKVNGLKSTSSVCVKAEQI